MILVAHCLPLPLLLLSSPIMVRASCQARNSSTVPKVHSVLHPSQPTQTIPKCRSQSLSGLRRGTSCLAGPLRRMITRCSDDCELGDVSVSLCTVQLRCAFVCFRTLVLVLEQLFFKLVFAGSFVKWNYANST